MRVLDFSYTPLQIRDESLSMDYFLVPWDTEIIGQPVAEIINLGVADSEKAKIHFSEFRNWCELKKITLCNCRIKHDQLIESFFLQDHGFRFVELNYLPEFHRLQTQRLSDESIKVEVALEEDKEQLAHMAGEIFGHGRFHQDVSLGPLIGNERYKTWLLNSFSRPSQTVYKCLLEGDIVGFFVVEYRRQKSCYWSLTGLAPGNQGRGLGTRVWKAMMLFHQNEGMESILTSISSHNAAVFNLYVKLGFRFPLPQTTFHWRP